MSSINSVKNYKYSILVKKIWGIKNLIKARQTFGSKPPFIYILLADFAGLAFSPFLS